MTTNDGGSSAEHCDSAEHSTQEQNDSNGLESLTSQLVEFLAPEINHIIAILRKLQLSLEGIPTPGEDVENDHSEDDEEKDEEEEEEEEEEEKEEEQKSGDLHLALDLIRLCRLDVEKSATEEDATLHIALMDVLEELEMNDAVDCLRRIGNIWRKQDGSSSEADQAQTASTQKTSPAVTSFRSHRTVLRETLASLVDRLAITDTLLSILMKKSVINHHMVTLILGRPNRQQQVVQLIELLTQLGPYSLDVFIEALTETDNVALANALKWSLSHAPLDIDNK